MDFSGFRKGEQADWTQDLNQAGHEASFYQTLVGKGAGNHGLDNEAGVWNMASTCQKMGF